METQTFEEKKRERETNVWRSVHPFLYIVIFRIPTHIGEQMFVYTSQLVSLSTVLSYICCGTSAMAAVGGGGGTKWRLLNITV